ncbi:MULTISPECIES: tripartite tricarboxylate transporter substrate binding protein [unclassified Beijerinckia]|uniref:Bug family tripartite tricarboxylate transporter substrate binding protein n=1 Tax=unclassified Beijerinckia TaxID=2638183 RepID=UPI00089A1E09|nr:MULTISPECIES: tripartite tricarboxylate transporter substrate binding protein [unclassified Beijerinckia]MDH7797230.1 tripartite-type tricarboxylate transporter receptor subunit TctC [Beijerinckia sp. GAS462]SEC77204.1 Tripartite-type tricarboxylate transporter, receptor component TctC [Beijerinckia sp. 28-YEA-48]
MTTSGFLRRDFASAALSMFAGIVGLALTAGMAQSQTPTWPTRPIRLVLPFAPGGPTDVVARMTAQILQEGLGQAAIVENRPGAGGATGVRSVAQAEPDGYTILMGSVATLASVPAVQKNAGFDPNKSFAHVVRLTTSSTLLIVPVSLPVNTVADFVAYAKANPGKLNFASAGYGNQTHLNVELFKAKTGIGLTHVPYKSGAEMVTALLANDVQLTFSDISVILPLVEDKRVKALAVASEQRTPLLPDLPTAIEAGVPDFTTGFWTGLSVPAGTPAAIVNRINKVVVEGLNAPNVRAALIKMGSTPSPTTPEEYTDFVAAEVVKWDNLVKQAGIKLD